MKTSYKSTCPACRNEGALTTIDTESSLYSHHIYCGRCGWCSCEDEKEALFATPLRVEIPYHVRDANNFLIRSGVVSLTEHEFAEFEQSLVVPKADNMVSRNPKMNHIDRPETVA